MIPYILAAASIAPTQIMRFEHEKPKASSPKMAIRQLAHLEVKEK